MIEKSMMVRSKKLRRSAEGERCTLRLAGHCNGDPATSVLCHLPHGGGGVGMKASDDHAVIACSGCHDAIDGRVKPLVDAAEVYECMIRAIAETHAIWRAHGLVVYQ